MPLNSSLVRKLGYTGLHCVSPDVQGILPNGASYLYVDRDQAIALSGRRDLRGGVSADAFESLSPALFSSQIELAEKLRKYEQKASKKKTLVRDTSVLNRDFTWDSGRSPVGVARASFELQRYWSHHSITISPSY